MLAPASEVMPTVNAYIPELFAWWWVLTVSAFLFGDLFIAVVRAVVVALRVKSRGFYMRLVLFFVFGLALGGVLTAAWGGVFS
jgi:hypothetical protein